MNTEKKKFSKFDNEITENVLKFLRESLKRFCYSNNSSNVYSMKALSSARVRLIADGVPINLRV